LLRLLNIYFYVDYVYLYHNQIYIEDKEYLKEIIVYHSMAILTSEEILQKTQSDCVKKLAENIIDVQEKEIDYMKQLIKYQ